MTEANHLFDRLLKTADLRRRFAIIPGRDGDKTRYYSYQDVFDVSGKMANHLVALGVEPGDRVAAQIPKSIEGLMLYLATVRAGGVFLPLNTAYTGEELDYFISDAQPRLFLCDPSNADSYAAIAAKHGAKLETMGVWRNPDTPCGSFLAGAEKRPAAFATVERGPDDLAAILYTSGTTGRSKGAMLSHANLASNAATLRESWRFTADDVLLHALPIFHTHGLFVASNVVLCAGASMIFLENFNAQSVLTHLPDATTMMGVPTFYTRLLDEPGFTRELAQHMRLFISGSAPLLAETHQAFEKRTGHHILERYGMTETNMNTSNPYDGERRPGTVGFPLPGVEVKVTDPQSGATLERGEVGVLEVRGPNVFRGYWQMPEKTREELREDGFFITGDLGLVDAEGYVTIVGRNKDLIIAGGYNIYPKEIELVLDEQPGVLESAVIGVRHPDMGEGVVAVLVAKAGQQPNVDAIRQNVSEKLARFKQPRHYALASELPRNTMGKVQKNALRETYADVFRP